MTMTRAGRILKVLVISLAMAAISRGGAVGAATLPVIATQGGIEKALRTPTGLAVDRNGDLYVSDPANRGVLRFTAAGKLAQSIAVRGVPEGIALTGDGRLLVSLGTAVAIYDAAGTQVGQLGAGAGQFKRASGIAIDDAGTIYVTDSKDASVQLFTNSGAYQSRWGAGQFRFPTAIAFEKVSRQIAVVDSLNARVQFYDLAGTPVRSIGANGTGPLKFMHPQGLAFEYGADSSVRMYVSDSMLKKIQVIEPTGTGVFLSFLTDARDGHTLPSALTFDNATRRLYLVNGSGGVTYYQIADGSAVVDSVVPANATVITSTAQVAGATVDVAAVTAAAPYLLSTVADGSTVSETILDVSGVVTGTVAVAVNGLPVAVHSGLFSTAVPLTAGANEVTVTVTDAAGTCWREVRKVICDAGAPALTVATPDVQATRKGVLPLKGTVSRTSFISVAGVPADLSKLEWSSSVTLAKGLNTIEIQAIDLNGQAATEKRTVFFSPAAPELAITAPAEDQIIRTNKVTVRGSVAADAAPAVTAIVNGITKRVKVAGGQFTLPVDFPQEGTYSITVSATAGGDTSTVTRTLIYRKAP